MISFNKHFNVLGLCVLSLYGIVWALITKFNMCSNRTIDISLLLIAITLLALFFSLDYTAKIRKNSTKKCYILFQELATVTPFAVAYFAIFLKFDELLMIILGLAIAVRGLTYPKKEKH